MHPGSTIGGQETPNGLFEGNDGADKSNVALVPRNFTNYWLWGDIGKQLNGSGAAAGASIRTGFGEPSFGSHKIPWAGVLQGIADVCDGHEDCV
jgi:hypothetical protein